MAGAYVQPWGVRSRLQLLRESVCGGGGQLLGAGG